MTKMEWKGTIRAVCISPEKGTAKTPVEKGVLIPDFGLQNDAHAGKGLRQVSLLPYESVEAFNRTGGTAGDGAFGENLLVQGIDLKTLPVGSLLRVGGATLRITQIGKACHSACAIRRQTGDCVMPREGVFAKVLSGGEVRPGDALLAQSPEPNRPFRAAVITVSDRCAKGERKDESGPAAVYALSSAGYEIVDTLVVSDDPERLKKELLRLTDSLQPDLIVTSGGTGFSPRDTTPEATLAVAERNAPGIAEYLRLRSLEKTPTAILSRGVSVIRKHTLIVNLPGSPRAVQDCMEFILTPLEHGLKALRGEISDCGRKKGN